MHTSDVEVHQVAFPHTFLGDPNCTPSLHTKTRIPVFLRVPVFLGFIFLHPEHRENYGTKVLILACFGVVSFGGF